MRFKLVTNKKIGTIDAVPMNSRFFNDIKNEEYTPQYIYIEDKHVLVCNEHTCHAGYAGLCACMSHPRKSWRKYDLQTGNWGGILK